jgi:hypothetical protein
MKSNATYHFGARQKIESHAQNHDCLYRDVSYLFLYVLYTPTQLLVYEYILTHVTSNYSSHHRAHKEPGKTHRSSPGSVRSIIIFALFSTVVVEHKVYYLTNFNYLYVCPLTSRRRFSTDRIFTDVPGTNAPGGQCVPPFNIGALEVGRL